MNSQPMRGAAPQVRNTTMHRHPSGFSPMGQSGFSGNRLEAHANP